MCRQIIAGKFRWKNFSWISSDNELLRFDTFLWGLQHIVHLHPACIDGNQLLFLVKIDDGVLNLILEHLEQNLRLVIFF